jgi:hypothetical protein
VQVTNVLYLENMNNPNQTLLIIPSLHKLIKNNVIGITVAYPFAAQQEYFSLLPCSDGSR